MTAETISVFFISLILLWVKPGPGQAFKITRVLNDGVLAGFYTIIGIITACIIFFLIAVLGLSLVTQFFEQGGFAFKIMGALYLFYLGYTGFMNIEKGKWQGRLDKSHKLTFTENYFSALLLTLANPLPIFYFLGIMPTLVPIGDFELKDILTGIGIIIIVGLLVDTILMLLVHEIKESLSNTQFIKGVNLVTSTGFILIGLFFLYSAFFLSNFSFHIL